jgi:polysaccharide pyruvyl transferase WcaK-like protein
MRIRDMKYKSNVISIKINNKKLKSKVKQALVSEEFANKKERKEVVKKIMTEAACSAGEGFENVLNTSVDTTINKYGRNNRQVST